MEQKPEFNEIVYMGDSLTDQGAANERMIGHVLPLRRISGLHGLSPLGRFTNGLTWSDNTSAKIANKLTIDELKKTHRMDSTDIADAVIDRNKKVADSVRKNYHLRDDQAVKYKGYEVTRNYAEGGLSSHSYKYVPTHSFGRLFSRLVLSTLGQMRARLLAHDKEHAITAEQKAKILVCEWSGENDFMTLNEKPSEYEAKRAIFDRIENASELIKNGYKHFVLFNLPDISLTPRYQAQSQAEQENAHHCIEFFNARLARKVAALQEANPDCTIRIFDVNSLFNEVYNNPAKFGFDPKKRNQPYVSSPEFLINKDNTSPAPKHIFFDGVHPSAKMHALLAEYFDEKVLSQFTFTPPTLRPAPQEPPRKAKHLSGVDLLEKFFEKYTHSVRADFDGWFGFFRKAYLNLHLLDRRLPLPSLKIILAHAFHESGARTRAVIADLGWIDGHGQLKSNDPNLKQAMAEIQEEQAQAVKPSSSSWWSGWGTK